MQPQSNKIYFWLPNCTVSQFLQMQEAMIRSLGPWPGILLAVLCLAQHAKLCTAYRLAVIMKLRENFPVGYHELRDVAKSLERRDHQVDLKSVHIPGTDWRALVTKDDLVTPKYDAILASGISALTGERVSSQNSSQCQGLHMHAYICLINCLPAQGAVAEWALCRGVQSEPPGNSTNTATYKGTPSSGCRKLLQKFLPGS